MASKREQILATITSTLAGTASVGTRIYRSRVDAFARSEAPALVIQPGQDQAQTYSTCKLDWSFDVVVAVYTRGTIPDQLADSIIVSLNSKLMADRTLGGLAMDIVPTLVDPQFDKADQTALWTVCTYRVRYRTDSANLAS